MLVILKVLAFYQSLWMDARPEAVAAEEKDDCSPDCEPLKSDREMYLLSYQPAKRKGVTSVVTPLLSSSSSRA